MQRLKPTDFARLRRIAEPPIAGSLSGKKVDSDTVASSYYEIMAWDAETSKPLESTWTAISAEGYTEDHCCSALSICLVHPVRKGWCASGDAI